MIRSLQNVQEVGDSIRYVHHRAGFLAIDICTQHIGWRDVRWGDCVSFLACQLAHIAYDVVGFGVPAELGIRLTNDDEIKILNARWRGKNQVTNVLSFPSHDKIIEGQRLLLGDIVLASEIIMVEALRDSKPLLDHFRHLVLHGVLHLLGYDHEDNQEAKKMELLEVRILADFGIKSPYDSNPSL